MTEAVAGTRWRRAVSAWATLGATLIVAAWLAGCAADSGGDSGAGGSSSGASGGRYGTGGAGTGGASASGGNVGPSSGGSSSTGGSGHLGGSTGAGGSSAGGAGGGPPPTCAVTIEAVAPSTLSDVISGKGARLEVKARLTVGMPTEGSLWTWEVTRWATGASSLESVAVEPLTRDASTVAFSTEVAGRYQIAATYPGVPRTCKWAIDVVAGPPKPQVLRWLVEPATGANLPAREIPMSVEDVRAGMALDLGDTSVASIAPSTETSQIVPAYVRLTTSTIAGWSLEGSTASGPWNVPLLAGVTYDLLIIPAVKVGTPGAYAPVLVSGPPARLGPALSLSPGRALAVEARDELGKPWAGVNALFANGALPSTLGTTGPDGSVVVRTATVGGAWAASFSGPASAGRYAIRSDGLDLTAASKLTITWAAQTRRAFSVTATDAAGTPLANARIRLANLSPVAGAATLTVARDDGSSAMASAAGVFSADALTDAQGVATFPAVPTGDFTATIFPDNTAGLASSAITASPVSVGGTVASTTVRARRRTTFDGTASTGTATTAKPCAASGRNDVPCVGMNILALADAEEVTPTTVVAADGTFHLALDPLLTYELVARPGPQQFAPQTVLGPVSLADPTQKTVFLLPEVTSTPVTVRAAGQPVAGAWVRVYCVAGAPRCADPNLPLAEGRSDDRGQLNLPLPASL